MELDINTDWLTVRRNVALPARYIQELPLSEIGYQLATAIFAEMLEYHI
jgi:hypothetical protein